MDYFCKISIGLLLLPVFVISATAHTYHTSLTRIDFNEKAKSLEIEINLFNHDVEKVFGAKYKKRVDFDNKQELDKMLADYLSETFIVKDTDGFAKKLVWIGKEIKRDMTTVFVEIEDVKKIENLQLQNKIFFESFAEQTNLVTIHSAEKKYDLAFRAGDDFKNFMAEKK